MKKIFFRIKKDNTVGIIPEHKDDIWHLYNLISPKDLVTASTMRKVRMMSGAINSDTVVKKFFFHHNQIKRIRLNLCVSIENISVDLNAEVIRLSGKNTTESEHIQIGQYHTLKITPETKITIKKEIWDSLALDRLNTALDSEVDCDLVVVLMQQVYSKYIHVKQHFYFLKGLANVFLVSPHFTLHKIKIEKMIPKKNPLNASKQSKVTITKIIFIFFY